MSKNKLIKIKLAGSPSDAKIELDGGDSLGSVDSINIEATPGNSPDVIIGTHCSEIEVEALQKNTELQITLWDDYKKKDLVKKWRSLSKELEMEGDENFDAGMIGGCRSKYAESETYSICADELEKLLIEKS